MSYSRWLQKKASFSTLNVVRHFLSWYLNEVAREGEVLAVDDNEDEEEGAKLDDEEDDDDVVVVGDRGSRP